MVNRQEQKSINTDNIPVYCAHDEMADIITLVPNPRNPKQHPQKQIELLAKIIKNQDWRASMTVSNRSGFVVRGHGRLLAAQLLGVSQVSCRSAGLCNRSGRMGRSYR